jgi:thiopeptide-type bacteriocin biosynthesis protein
MSRPDAVRAALAEFRTAGFFVVRSGTLPFEVLVDWGRPVESGIAAEVRADRLRAVVESLEMRERVFVASPSIEERMSAWLARATPPEESRRIEQAIGRYVQRMAWRATPFGLFAGTSVGVVGGECRIAFGPRACERRRTRLDAEILGAVAVALGRDPGIRPHLRYHPNATLHVADDEVSFVVARAEPGPRHRGATMTRTPALEVVLAAAAAAEGATPAALVSALLAADPRTPAAVAERFVQGLIDAQVVVDDLDPPLVSADPLGHLIARLEGIEAAGATRRVLARAQSALERTDSRAAPTPPAEYRELARGLEELPARSELSRTFHVLLHRPVAHATLDERFLGEVLAGVAALQGATPPPPDPLATFRRELEARYGEREVPIQEALSETRGIGFERSLSSVTATPPLLRGLEPAPREAQCTATWGAREAWLASRVTSGLRARQLEIALDDAALAELAGPRAPLPDSFSVLASVHGEGAGALGSGSYRVHLRQLLGPTAALLLGRFAATDPALHAHVRELARREDALVPGAILAELVHASHPWMGNVASRPALRAHEIVLLGSSENRQAVRIPLSDLTVSVHGGVLVLRSRAQGRRVIPRMTYADNLALPGVPAYRFLALLASQCSLPVTWSWGALDLLPDLPRVTYRRCIFALARWRLDAATTGALETASDEGRRDLLRSLREERGIPRWVALAQGDKSLPVDTENPASVDSFLQIGGGKEVVLEEMFPGPGAPFFPGPEGQHAHELVLPFLRKAPLGPEEPPRAAIAPIPPRRRAHLPGEEWLYAKLYCAEAATDRVLRDVVLPLVEDAHGARWFFVRYADPDWHVRLRIQAEPALLRDHALPLLRRLVGEARDRGWVHRLALDTYAPEIERYGGTETLALSEQLFHHDSEAALHLAITHPDPEARWRLALLGIHRLLALLAPALAARHAIAAKARDDFAREQGLLGRHARPIGERFRRDRAELAALVRGDVPGDHSLRLGLDILDERDAKLAAVASALGAACEGTPGLLARVAADVLHLHVNRVLVSEHRAQEAVLYDLLARLVAAERARA